jgi:phosphoglucomutase
MSTTANEETVNVPRLVTAYYTTIPDPHEPGQRVAFGTSGHRGSALRGSFNEAHVLAVTEAIVRYRRQQGYDGPVYLGMDTHALSEPAFATAQAVLLGHGLTVRVDHLRGYTPTPVVSHAILGYNRGRDGHYADGIIITPSHNPPEDGGIKYNPPHGGPAESVATSWIEAEANRLLETGVTAKRPAHGARLELWDYTAAYVDDLANAIDLKAIRASGIRLGADPLGGAALGYLAPIAERHGIDLTIVNTEIDPAFRFMPPDHDGRIRMDCSSTAAMRNLIAMRDRYDLAFGNDPDADRHGIVTRGGGLMNPNHYLAVAIDYLFRHRQNWPSDAAIGKTVVTSALIDRVAAGLGRTLFEVPVGFKWFVTGLHDARLGFAGEESAGASFLRRNGTVWTTDKDGLLLGLLAAEILAVTGEDPAAHYTALTARYGKPCYARRDLPVTAAGRAAIGKLAPADLRIDSLAGEPVTAVLTRAPGDGNGIGGLKVLTGNGWFAVRPSGTEDICKIYAESLRDEAHLAQIQSEAQALVEARLAKA